MDETLEEKTKVDDVTDVKNEQNGGDNSVDTNTVKNESEGKTEETKIAFSKEQQEYINDLIRERVDRAKQSVYTAYGFNDKNELDDFVGKGMAYNVTKERLDKTTQEKNDLTRQLLFTKNKVNGARYDDIDTYFKGKSLEFNEENFSEVLKTHPEWIESEKKEDVVVNDKPKTTIKVLGTEQHELPKESERDIAAKFFGFKNGFVNR